MIKDQLDVKRTADDIASQLGETEPAVKAVVFRIVRAAGVEKATALLAETLEIEQNGGLQVPDGSRRRTIGGVFFYRAKQVLTSQQRFAVWGLPRKRQTATIIQNPPVDEKKAPQIKQPAPIFTWEDRITALQEAETEKGHAMTAKMTLIGRPRAITEQSGCIVTIMEENKVPSLPKGLPVPTSAPTKYAVYIASKQWAKVKDAIADPDDALIIEGFPKTDPEVSAIALFCTNITTKKLQQAQRAEKKAP